MIWTWSGIATKLSKEALAELSKHLVKEAATNVVVKESIKATVKVVS